MAKEKTVFSALSKRTQNVLKTSGIVSIEQLCAKTSLEIHRLPGCGYKTETELEEFVRSKNLIFRVDKPEEGFSDLYEKLAKEYEIDQGFRDMGERYGIDAALMYQIYSGLERAVKGRAKVFDAHNRWSRQFAQDVE